VLIYWYVMTYRPSAKGVRGNRMEYKVVSEDDVSEFESSVNMYIGMGWRPLGGVCRGNPVFDADYYNENLRGFTPSRYQYLQAMIRD